MATTIVSMFLSLAWMWHGRDNKIWTPTYKGTRQERFITAMHHYHEKMGLEQDLVFEIRPSHPKFCAWVRSGGGPSTVIVGFSQDCTNVKPEVLALHESCHVRWAHPYLAMDSEVKHVEVASCMVDYSKKERR